MGAILVALTAGVLLLDQALAPWYPFLFGFLVLLALAGCYELLNLLPPSRRPPAWLCYPAVAALVVANWPAHFLDRDAWPWVWGTFAAVMLSARCAQSSLAAISAR